MYVCVLPCLGVSAGLPLSVFRKNRSKYTGRTRGCMYVCMYVCSMYIWPVQQLWHSPPLESDSRFHLDLTQAWSPWIGAPVPTYKNSVCMYVCMYVCMLCNIPLFEVRYSLAAFAAIRRSTRQSFEPCLHIQGTRCMYVCMYVCMEMQSRRTSLECLLNLIEHLLGAGIKGW